MHIGDEGQHLVLYREHRFTVRRCLAPMLERSPHAREQQGTARDGLRACAGIGREVVAQLRASGHRVAAVGRDAEALAAVDADAHIAADTTTPEGAAAAIAACKDQLRGAPSLLAHCVGSTLISPLHRSTAVQIRDVLRINLDSALYMLQAWIEGLRTAKKPGAAVLVSSVVARVGVANHEAIAAAKRGIEALARSAAATSAPLGLRINVVAPGMTDTLMTAYLFTWYASDADVRQAGCGRSHRRGPGGWSYPLGTTATSIGTKLGAAVLSIQATTACCK